MSDIWFRLRDVTKEMELLSRKFNRNCFHVDVINIWKAVSAQVSVWAMERYVLLKSRN